MGVKRMETRLITEFLGERMKNLKLQQAALLDENKCFIGSDQAAKLFRIDGALSEVSRLYDILGGYNE